MAEPSTSHPSLAKPSQPLKLPQQPPQPHTQSSLLPPGVHQRQHQTSIIRWISPVLAVSAVLMLVFLVSPYLKNNDTRGSTPKTTYVSPVYQIVCDQPTGKCSARTPGCLAGNGGDFDTRLTDCNWQVALLVLTLAAALVMAAGAVLSRPSVWKGLLDREFKVLASLTAQTGFIALGLVSTAFVAIAKIQQAFVTSGVTADLYVGVGLLAITGCIVGDLAWMIIVVVLFRRVASSYRELPLPEDAFVTA
ncbi:hypothetical protein HK405_003282 [Cladochytrium tenue]|nr:hypothetical protein HK405_003282 [Cladochytrium tenue]